MIPEVVVFDLGGVLVELDMEWPAHAGLDPSAVFDWCAQSPAYAALERGELSEARFLQAFVSDFPGAEATAVRDAFARCPRRIWPGAVELLDSLDIRTACLSNTNRIHWEAFDPERALRDRLDPPLASHHIGARKPERAAFARASAMLGTDHVLFVDDNAFNVAAARDFGWQAEQVFGPEAARAAIEAAL